MRRHRPIQRPMPYRCPTHPKYRGVSLPVECEACWSIYGRAAARREVRSVGRARGGGQSSKAKGRSAVVLVAELLREAFGLDAADVYIKATSQIGADLHLSPAALAVFPCAIEVKNCEKLNVWKALAQADAFAPHDLTPILFFKRARTDLYVSLRATAFLRMIHDCHRRRAEIDSEGRPEGGDGV